MQALTKEPCEGAEVAPGAKDHASSNSIVKEESSKVDQPLAIDDKAFVDVGATGPPTVDESLAIDDKAFVDAGATDEEPPKVDESLAMNDKSAETMQPVFGLSIASQLRLDSRKKRQRTSEPQPPSLVQ